MRESIIQSTIDALRSVRNIRFFKTERGYHGRFYCALQSALEERGILSENIILEMEYQKSSNRHETRQRPDIILHVPVEVSGSPVTDNNYAVWALKYRGGEANASDDFEKLDLMFEKLHYPLGVFINIDSADHHLQYYKGRYRDFIVTFAIILDDSGVRIIQAYWSENQIIENHL